ncbi:MAG: hypothetical protein R2731_14275 [Nocardioides sp.]
MISPAAARIVGVLGGLSWILRWFLRWQHFTEANSAIDVVVHWLGATWLAIAVVAAGTSLVRHAPLWLRLLIGAAVLLLGLVALSLAYELGYSRVETNAFIGGAVAILSVVLPRYEPPIRKVEMPEPTSPTFDKEAARQAADQLEADRQARLDEAKGPAKRRRFGRRGDGGHRAQG